MATQTGSIDLTATNAVHLYAEGEYATKDELTNDYYSKSDFTLTPSQIESKVTKTETAIAGSYATCSTGASTAAKAATITPALTGWELYEGAAITVKFTSANTSASPTLNVNSTGAKAIRSYEGSALTEDEYEWPAGACMTFVYDGTYWRVQDSTALVRMAHAESSITQNANDILLRATKTEAKNLVQPNLTPFFATDLNDKYNATTNPGGFWQSTAAYDGGYITKLADGWVHAERDNSSGASTTYITLYSSSVWQQANAPIKPGSTYTILAEVRNIVSGSNSYFSVVSTSSDDYKGMFAPAVGGSVNGKFSDITNGELRGTTTARSDLSESNTVTRSIISIIAGESVSCDIRISIYEGEYIGPFKPYVDTALRSYANAQFKIQAEAIESRVEKNGVISSINQSAEAITIDASRVNIAGAAIFTSGRLSEDSLNAAYDASGAAEAALTSAQSYADNAVNDIDIGGRNLLKNSAALTTGWSKENTTVTDGIATITKASSGNSRIYQMPANGYWGSWVVGDTFTVSVEAKGTTSGCRLSLTPNNTSASGTGGKNFDLTTEWTRYSYTFTVARASTSSMSFANNGTTDDVIQLRYPKLEKGTKATDWTPAPEDVSADISAVSDVANAAAPKANAVKRTHRIYYRKSSSGAPDTPSAWVTQTADVRNQWAAKVPQLTDSNNVKYPYLYTCEQREMVDGDLEYTAVLLDDSTTVIDGGSIITNSITANKLDVADINVSNSLTIGALSSTTQDDVLNSNVVIGGRNLALGTATLQSVTKTSTGAKVIKRYDLSEFASTVLSTTSKQYISFDIKVSSGEHRIHPYAGIYVEGTATTTSSVSGTHMATTEWTRISLPMTLTATPTWVQVTANSDDESNGVTYEMRNLKLETGTKPTDWTPAPEDEETARKATYGTCSTASGTTAKVVVCDGFDVYSGARLTVKFSNASTASAPTLTINDSSDNTILAAKAIWNNNAAVGTSNPLRWGANATISFVYDGTEWVLDEKPPSYLAGCTTASTTRSKSASIAGALVVNGTTLVLNFSNANEFPTEGTDPDSSSVQINLSSTGAANVYRDRVVTSLTNRLDWDANTSLTFVRSGSGWQLADNKSRTLTEEAAKTATYYLTADSSGLMVHDANAPTTGVQITSSVDIMRSGVSTANFGGGTNGDTARVGPESGNHISVDSDSIDMMNGGKLVTTFSIDSTEDGDDYGDTTQVKVGRVGGAVIEGVESHTTLDEGEWTHTTEVNLRANDVMASDDSDDDINNAEIFLSVQRLNHEGSNLAESEIRLQADNVGVKDPLGNLGAPLWIGKPTSLYDTGNVSVANSSWVKVAQLTIPSTGTWLVVLSGDFASNATGRRVVACARTDPPTSAPSYDSQNSLIMAPANGAATKFSSSAIIDFTAGDVYYASVWQNSGGALTTRIMIKAVRLI